MLNNVAQNYPLCLTCERMLPCNVRVRETNCDTDSLIYLNCQ